MGYECCTASSGLEVPILTGGENIPSGKKHPMHSILPVCSQIAGSFFKSCSLRVGKECVDVNNSGVFIWEGFSMEMNRYLGEMN